MVAARPEPVKPSGDARPLATRSPASDRARAPVNAASPKALVVLRVPRGAGAPAEPELRAAIAADRARLALPPAELVAFRLAGPYAIDLEGRALDEYVAWEV